MNRDELFIGLSGLVIFRNLLESKPIIALVALLDADQKNTRETVNAYCTFAAELFKVSDSFDKFLAKFITEDENLYIKSILANKKREVLDGILNTELDFLNRLAKYDGADARAAVGNICPLPAWKNSGIDLKETYFKHIAGIPTNGFGIYAKYHVFTLSDSGDIQPVKNPDPQKLSDLFGYEAQREKIISNTLTLLKGGKANNALLYGDAGTGKSSTVKGIANEYKSMGLRLIEIGKKQLYLLPELLDTLANNPLKFIIFIDDLCFDSDDKDFSAFKAILEGSVGARRDNTVIYATSNHRHMVKERANDRYGEEININDTLQEQSSLSARFGLTLTFERPNKLLFESIVENLADKYCPDMDKSELVIKAEAFAIRSGGRNARVAKQFIEMINAGIIK